MDIKFCGAATGVTGSCHLLTWRGHQILLDCGQFQGGRAQEAMNFEPFPFDPREIECVILSHAHIDHCGRLPLLVKRGFKGTIYCTKATADLLEIMLIDSAYIHEKEAEWKNKKNQRAGRPLIEPLYTYQDAVEALTHVSPVLYDQLKEINDSAHLVFNDAGHILGSAIVELWVTEEKKTSKIVFSGDLGVMDRPILRDPTRIKKADYVIMETTYGNRNHPKEHAGMEALLDIVEKTVARGGTVVIPSFAVGRTQELIYEFNKYYATDNKYRKTLDKIKIYIDSPMATKATEVFKENAQVFDEETKSYLLEGNNPLDFDNLVFTKTTEESKALNADKNPKIIISASGMCEAGRIRHHLRYNLWDKNASIIFVGYQAEGTLGRSLLEGLDEAILFGEPVKVRAQIHNLQGFSGHADQQGLLWWLGGFKIKPKKLFLVHGEVEAKRDFATLIKEKLGYDGVVISQITQYRLESGEELSKEENLQELVDEKMLEEMQKTIGDIHYAIERFLYDSKLAVAGNSSLEKTIKINNTLRELHKDTIELGSILYDNQGKSSS